VVANEVLGKLPPFPFRAGRKCTRGAFSVKLTGRLLGYDSGEGRWLPACATAVRMVRRALTTAWNGTTMAGGIRVPLSTMRSSFELPHD
jgi:hypothetical protein